MGTYTLLVRVRLGVGDSFARLRGKVAPRSVETADRPNALIKPMLRDELRDIDAARPVPNQQVI